MSPQLLAELFDTCFLTGKVTQVVKLGAAYTSTTDDFDLVDTVTVDREDTLDTDTVRTDLAHVDRRTSAVTALGNTDTLIVLYTGLLTLFDRDGQTQCITCAKIRDILSSDLGILEVLYVLIFHKMSFFDAVKAVQA